MTAKPKRPTKPAAPTLTAIQFTQLGNRLIDTRQNVYHLAKSMFGAEFTDELWQQLEKQEGIFRCEECGMWKGADVKEDGIDRCSECENAMNEGDDES